MEGFDEPCSPEEVLRPDAMLKSARKPPVLIGGREGLSSRMRYPYKAAVLDLEGQVCLDVSVDDEGKVEEVEVVRSIHPILDAEAVRAVSASSFEPALQDGKPVASRVSMTMRYTIIGGSDTTGLIAGTGAVLLAGIAAYYLIAVPAD